MRRLAGLVSWGVTGGCSATVPCPLAALLPSAVVGVQPPPPPLVTTPQPVNLRLFSTRSSLMTPGRGAAAAAAAAAAAVVKHPTAVLSLRGLRSSPHSAALGVVDKLHDSEAAVVLAADGRGSRHFWEVRGGVQQERLVLARPRHQPVGCFQCRFAHPALPALPALLHAAGA
jgi:hypothetical protein